MAKNAIAANANKKKWPSWARELTPVEYAFLQHYFVDGNAVRAMMAAKPHITYNTASIESSALLKTIEVSNAIAAFYHSKSSVYGRIFDEAAALAFHNPADMFDDNGKLLPIKQMPRASQIAVKKFKVRREVRSAGKDKDPDIEDIIEVDTVDKLGALNFFGKLTHAINDIEATGGADQGSGSPPSLTINFFGNGAPGDSATLIEQPAKLIEQPKSKSAKSRR